MMEDFVFVAGANHTGSTLAGCILGHDPTGQVFHAGELHAFVQPGGRRHGDEAAAGRMPGGDVWARVRGANGYWETLDRLSDVLPARTLVDSSKLVEKLLLTYTYCASRGIPFTTLVTYRPFSQIWNSDERRGRSVAQMRAGLYAYAELLNLTEDLGTRAVWIDTRKLIAEPAAYGQRMCKACDVEWFDGKERYWDHPNAHLYGSGTQRKHMGNPAAAGYDPSRVSRSAGSDSYPADAELERIEAQIQERLLD
ncbi:hypothetical protein JQC91_07070 [Jannaschia sp. Os4]|uniref:hypothetical protein n=1 Tax=Jannaschia sp. Os4 TaxID=2807617 RepID=UPI001939F0E8|nr:hypothetical protein [Jannaschia sp. Os4]MBM2576061.1 hypothetical protein [Jannaschia sp. Os4]